MSPGQIGVLVSTPDGLAVTLVTIARWNGPYGPQPRYKKRYYYKSRHLWHLNRPRHERPRKRWLKPPKPTPPHRMVSVATLPETIHLVLVRALRGLPGDDVAVMLSGGLDSGALVLAAKAAGKRPVGYTFMLDGKLSTDFQRARAFAARAKIPHVPVLLPRNLDQVEADLRFLITELGCRGKAEIECTWPFLYAIPAVAEAGIATGSCADGHFGVSKKAMIHYRHNAALLDQFRAETFGKPNYAQVLTLTQLAARHGKTIVAPYRDPDLLAAFRGTTWEQINRPKQKQPIIDAFPAMAQLSRIVPHTNLQLGDSGIAELFTRLLPTLGGHKWRSTVGIYNAIAKGEL
jgi:asparagine synthetase B (glutamine-hydrolysing)